jgi:3-phenylpropionate/trans-cinnamate dioxygenase ferredoxin subunit
MNQEVEPIHIGEVEDIDLGSVENFEHEEIDYAIFHLESGFFATQGHCNCEDQVFIYEANVEGEELECASCSNIYSIVSGDPISNDELIPLRVYDVSVENGSIYLNL